MDPTGWVGGKFEVMHIHWRQLAYPFDQRLLALRVLADRPKHGRQVLAAIAQHGLARESGLSQLMWIQVQEAHVAKSLRDLFGARSVLVRDTLMPLELGQPGLIWPHLDIVVDIPRRKAPFPVQKQFPVAGPKKIKVSRSRLGRIYPICRKSETFCGHLKSPTPVFIPADLDRIGKLLHFDLKRERGLAEADDLIHCTANPRPFDLAASAEFAADDLRQRVAAADAVQEAERVADVALAAGIGADDDGERADAQRLVGEVLEIAESK